MSSHDRIIATFIPQEIACRPISNRITNRPESEWQEVDVTDAVLEQVKELGWEEVLDTFGDDTENTDWLIPEEIRDAHGGPFAVRVEMEISSYYDQTPEVKAEAAAAKVKYLAQWEKDHPPEGS